MINKICGIYKITSPSGRVYIGQSRDIKRRIREYKRSVSPGQVRLYESVNKYGWENHTFEIIEECELEELNVRERYWQDYYNVLEEGLNCVLIETDELPRVITEEAREELSRRLKGRIFSESHKNKISIALSGENNGMYGKTGILNPTYGIKRYGKDNHFFGKSHTPETKNKMSLAKKGKVGNRKGKTNSKEHNKKISKTKGIKVIQLDDNREEIKTWISTKDAEKTLGIYNISRAAKNGRKAGGYFWKYKRDFNLIKSDYNLKKTLEELLDSECFDSNVRAKYKDGEEAITRFLTHRFFEYDLQEGEFPLPTLRKTAVKTGIKEILWIYQKKSSNLEEAKKLGVNWWNSWDVGDGTIGARYGETVKRYTIIDNILDDLQFKKFSRRHIIDLYQYKDFEDTSGLHPCAFLSMFSVREIEGVNYLDLMLVLRSSDFITAGFINKIQYVSLLMMIVGHLNHETDEKWEIGKFSCAINNLHLYLRHENMAKHILKKEPILEQPRIELKNNKNFYDYKISDFKFYIPKGIKALPEKLELAI